MATKTSKKEMMSVYKERGLNGLYSFLRKKGKNFSKSIIEFGLSESTKAAQEKEEWLEGKTDIKTIRFHYYSVCIHSRKIGYNYNIIRGIEIIIK